MNQLSKIFILPIVLLLYSCGGGGVPETFTKELNEFETAWTNTEMSFMGVLDSVSNAALKLNENNLIMTLPDSVSSKINPANKLVLDSIKNINAGNGQACNKIVEELTKFKTKWTNDSKNFEDWKSKVLKGEIDIETAKKDLAEYKSKLAKSANVSTKGYNRLIEVRESNYGNTIKFTQLLAKYSAEQEDEKPK